jgi:hypothetical protein
LPYSWNPVTFNLNCMYLCLTTLYSVFMLHIDTYFQSHTFCQIINILPNESSNNDALYTIFINYRKTSYKLISKSLYKREVFGGSSNGIPVSKEFEDSKLMNLSKKPQVIVVEFVNSLSNDLFIPTRMHIVVLNIFPKLIFVLLQWFTIKWRKFRISYFKLHKRNYLRLEF